MNNAGGSYLVTPNDPQENTRRLRENAIAIFTSKVAEGYRYVDPRKHEEINDGADIVSALSAGIGLVTFEPCCSDESMQAKDGACAVCSITQAENVQQPCMCGMFVPASRPRGMTFTD